MKIHYISKQIKVSEITIDREQAREHSIDPGHLLNVEIDDALVGVVMPPVEDEAVKIPPGG